MRISRLLTCALVLGAAAVMTTGCGGGTEASSFGVNPNLGLRSDVVPVMPDKHKKKMLFQYEGTSSGILEFDYPKSDRSIGEIGGVAQGECTNVIYGAGKQIFWATDSGTDQIDEYRVNGSRPIKTLSTPSGDVPVGCAMDPGTGNLAATIINNGAVVIYANASGSGTVSQSPLVEAFFDSYDKNGNLYVDGFNDQGAFGLAELEKGSSTWETLTTSNAIEFPGQVQYDGTYMTVNDQEAHDIFGYTCKGTSCKLKRTVSLSGSSDCDQTWIANGIVFCPDAGNVDGEVYKYPAGGSPVAILTGYGSPLAIVEVRE
jgi:hypothetical protein